MGRLVPTSKHQDQTSLHSRKPSQCVFCPEHLPEKGWAGMERDGWGAALGPEGRPRGWRWNPSFLHRPPRIFSSWRNGPMTWLSHSWWRTLRLWIRSRGPFSFSRAFYGEIKFQRRRWTKIWVIFVSLAAWRSPSLSPPSCLVWFVAGLWVDECGKEERKRGNENYTWKHKSFFLFFFFWSKRTECRFLTRAAF